MIVYNTTFSVSGDAVEEFIEWIRSTYVPQAMQGGRVSAPQLMRIMAQQEGGVGYALQLQTPSLGELQRWYQSTGKQLMADLTAHFGRRIAGFSTMMEQIEIGQ